MDLDELLSEAKTLHGALCLLGRMERDLVLTIPAQLKRVGIGMRFVVEGEPDDLPADPTLTRLLARAHTIRDRTWADISLGIDEIASQDDLVRSYVTRLLRLTFLAPDIVTRILAGRQPVDLTANRLMRDTRLPLDWAEQRRVLGFS